MNILPSLAKFRPSPKLAITILDSVVAYLDSIACTFAISVVHSKLDYCNVLYYNLPKSQVTRLQQIQNFLARAVVKIKAPKSCHISSILQSLQWLKITERIEYKPLLLTYEVFTTTQATYLHNLISVQPPRSTHSSSLVTLARPPTSSSLLITPVGMLHLVSGINFLVLSVNPIPVPLSLICLFISNCMSTRHCHHP